MRRTLSFPAAAALCALAFGVPAHSQTPAPVSEIKLTMEQTHVLKEFLLNDASIPKAARADFEVGQKVPADVVPRAFPEEVAAKVSAVKAHRFFVGGDKIFIVSKDDTISDIVE
jgi:hypothetical protein